MGFDLSADQRAAVAHAGGPAMVVAGPGSGKTRVLTHRVEWLANNGVGPRSVVALTFTRKAAEEMRTRLEDLGVRGAECSTLHSLGFRYLRDRRQHSNLDVLRFWDGRGVASSRQRVAMMERAVGDSGLDPVEALAKIDMHRANASPWSDVLKWDKPLAGVWSEYVNEKKAAHVIDYEDMCYLAWLTMRKHGAPKFGHVLVDEAQDLNVAQWRMIEQLAPPPSANVFVVGDFDQAIYGFRGANPKMLLRFTETYPDAARYELGMNYRSTPAIVSAASRLLESNTERDPKALRAAATAGEQVLGWWSEDSATEADKIVSLLGPLVNMGMHPNDCAVLVRCFWQTRPIEDELRRRDVPYRVVGGMSFWQRREVCDVIAYLRLALNRDDDEALLRIFNVPNRYLGIAARETLTATARRTERHYLDVLESLSSWPKPYMRRKAAELCDLLGSLRNGVLGGMSAAHAVGHVVSVTGYREWLRAHEDDADDRISNLDELIEAARSYQSVGALVQHASRAAAPIEDDASAVTITSIHRSKGREWPLVFVAGMSERVMPHEHATSDQLVEEERRLCYVAMTRAQRSLVLSGSAEYLGHNVEPSRFFVEAGIVPESRK